MPSIQKKRQQPLRRKHRAPHNWGWKTVTRSNTIPLILLAAFLSECCLTTNQGSVVAAFQGTLASRRVNSAIPTLHFAPQQVNNRRQFASGSGQCAVLTRLYDTERTEAEIKLSAQLDPRNEGNISSGVFEQHQQQHQGNVSTTTLVVQHQPDAATTDGSLDVPLRTENGGFSHTVESKAKISAANKGKTAWNKGKVRSAETKARIAAGVRSRNRENFLKKLEDLGVTEEDFEDQKKEARKAKDAERRARRTEKGGYRPTEETKQKISDILKAKWANGEIAKRRIDPEKVRRGFKHSEETRAKISEALKQRWANDSKYRENMVNKTTAVNGALDTRKKISETLKAKWQDPEFRETMLEKIRSRRTSSASRDASYRKKISEAMKKKWQDTEYRNKTTESIRHRANELARLRPPKPRKASRVKRAVKKSAPTTTVGIQLATVASPRVPRKPRTTKKTPTELDDDGEVVKEKVKKVVKKKKRVAKRAPTTIDSNGDVVPVAVTKKPKKAAKAQKAKKEPDGSINRLRDERRDLYDLLYGDEEGGGNNNNNKRSEEIPVSTGLAAMLDLEDENLDTFDPYGLENF